MVATLPHILVAGLGNAGYPRTRHSLGHLIVDALASRHGITLHTDRSKGGFYGNGEIIVGDDTILLSLFKSMSLMNVSGPSIANALRQTSRIPSSLILISDSLSHRVESVSLRLGGSANGHNGIKSVMKALGGEGAQFWRLRAGIGKNEGVDSADYVMQNLSSHERAFWSHPDGQGISLVMKEIENVARARTKEC